MRWLNKLEKKFGHLAIKNLMAHIVMITGIVYIIGLFDQRGTFLHSLTLVPARVLQGEVWRLITYIFIPPNMSPIFIIFLLHLYYTIGTGLERVWGSFRFNLFYLLGILATTIIAFLTRGAATPTFINLSLFLAFARLYPDFELIIFFILPVKIKYLAWFNWAVFIFNIFTAPLAQKITVIVALSNYFIFFAKEILTDLKRRKKVYNNRKRFDVIRYTDNKTIHRCTICGITEKDDPEMEFRYCSKCVGSYEYCSKHLKNHEHVQDQE